MEYEHKDLIAQSISAGEYRYAIEDEDYQDFREARLELDYVYSKAETLDRTAKHIATERWKLAEDLVGEDDEDVRRQILAELAVLQRIKDVMECETKRKEDEQEAK